MTTPEPETFTIETERYELSEEPSYRFGIARRDLFRALGGGLLVILALPGTEVQSRKAAPSSRQQESGGRRSGGGNNRTPNEIGAWLHIGEDGVVTAYTGKVEVGQNARTSLTQAVAEELRIAPASVRMVMGDTDLTPYDAGTFGSRTTPAMAPQMRRVAVAARERLTEMAAERYSVDRNALSVHAGKIAHGATGRSIGFGELTQGKKLTAVVRENTAAALTPPSEWKVIGKTLPKVNGADIVTGRHRYTSDEKRPDMLYGRVLRPSAFGATLATLNSAKAAALLPGVTVVRDGNFVGVTAPSTTAAEAALAALEATWTPSPAPHSSAKELWSVLKEPVEGQSSSGRGDHVVGSVDEAFASSATKKLSATYTVAYIAHAPLEPRAAIAEWQDGKLTVWTGTQRPFGVRAELAAAFGVGEDRIRVIVPDTGSGYGGKHTGECAVEAARLAKAAGKPVKLVWTRDEEFTWAYFRPAGVIDVTAGVSADGRITAWEYHNYNSGTSAIRPLYDIPHQKVVFHASRSPLRQGSYRGLAATANHFAREVQMDEMAHAVNADPLAFRLQNIRDERLSAVLTAAAEEFGWSKTKPGRGRGWGLACGFDKGGYVAACVEVAVDPASREFKSIERLVTAFECGAIVNPDHLKNQVEGAVVQGIGGALFEAIDFAEGQIGNPYFSGYRVPRFRDLPREMKTVLLDRKDLPSAGAGECPIVAIAPALGNALFAATGERLRSLPLLPKKRAA